MAILEVVTRKSSLNERQDKKVLNRQEWRWNERSLRYREFSAK